MVFAHRFDAAEASYVLSWLLSDGAFNPRCQDEAEQSHKEAKFRVAKAPLIFGFAMALLGWPTTFFTSTSVQKLRLFVVDM